MRNLKLRVTQKGKKFLFEAVEGNEVLASCTADSNRYVALFISNKQVNGKHGVYNRFGRYDLIGQGDSKKWLDMGMIYGIARLDF